MVVRFSDMFEANYQGNPKNVLGTRFYVHFTVRHSCDIPSATSV